MPVSPKWPFPSGLPYKFLHVIVIAPMVAVVQYIYVPVIKFIRVPIMKEI